MPVKALTIHDVTGLSLELAVALITPQIARAWDTFSGYPEVVSDDTAYLDVRLVVDHDGHFQVNTGDVSFDTRHGDMCAANVLTHDDHDAARVARELWEEVALQFAEQQNVDDDAEPCDRDVEQFVTQYIATALWSSLDEDDTPLDDSSYTDALSDSARATMREEATQWCRDYWPLFAPWWTASDAGHDLWLTRNGHGAGFWDRAPNSNAPHCMAGRMLAQHARDAGSRSLYVGDNGHIYHVEG